MSKKKNSTHVPGRIKFIDCLELLPIVGIQAYWEIEPRRPVLLSNLSDDELMDVACFLREQRFPRSYAVVGLEAHRRVYGRIETEFTPILIDYCRDPEMWKLEVKVCLTYEN